jgi:hypothetical protein
VGEAEAVVDIEEEERSLQEIRATELSTAQLRCTSFSWSVVATP